MFNNILFYYYLFHFCFFMCLYIHRWEESGIWLDLPLTPSGLLAAKPAWKWVQPCSPLLLTGTWTCHTPASSECERTDWKFKKKKNKGGGGGGGVNGDSANCVLVSLFPQLRWLLLENEQPGQEDWYAWKVHIHKWAWVQIKTHTVHKHIKAWDIHNGNIHIFLLSHDFNALPLSGWGNENDMRMVDVKYNEYALIHTIKTKGGDPTVVNKLYGNIISHHSTLLNTC